MLIYSNLYFIGGVTTSKGFVSSGRSPRRFVPSGLTACTAQHTC